MKKTIIYFLVVLFFIIYSLSATYPLVTQMGVVIKNLGDPLLNVWILNWDIHKFLTGTNNFFDANIFYPDSNTLAYSEHLIPQALLALPVFLITRQPIFIYNFLFILSFILSGLGVFFLVEHLTKNRIAAFLAGFIFAFSPFRFSHLGHLQILTMQWIPFAFLFFHKFIEEPKIRNLIFFSIFFILQVLSCSYYAFFLSMAVLIMVVFILINRKISLKKFLLLVSAGIIIGLILLPFFYPYYKFRKETEFKREITEVELYSARLENYLATPTGNRLLGKITERFVGGEAQLFPGITVLFLAIIATFKISLKKDEGGVKKTKVRVNRILDIFILFNCLLIVILKKWGGFDLNFASFSISVHSLRNPVYCLIFLIILRWFNSQDRKRYLALDYRGNLYLILAISSFILSLGPSLITQSGNKLINLPYLFLYNHIPGFQGLRVPARWGCFVIFALSVLAGFGIERIFNSFKKQRIILKCGITGLLFISLVVESVYVPLGYASVPQAVPAVYNWLAKEKGNFAIVELPMPIDDSRTCYETLYMYWSIYHWKDLVNGYSGFLSPSYWSINRAMQKFPSVESVKLLEALGVKYVIVHFNMLDKERIEKIKAQIHKFDEALKIKEKFDEDYVIEILRTKEKERF